MTTREAVVTMDNLRRAMGVDVDGVRTIAGARVAYVNNRISVAEFEDRVERILREGEPTVSVCSGDFGHVFAVGQTHCAACGTLWTP